MFLYIPSRHHLGYPVRRVYTPGSVQLYDEPFSQSLVHDERLSHAFNLQSRISPPRVDPEARYHNALRELQAAEREYQAYLAAERAREEAHRATQQAALEAAHHRRAHALQLRAETERKHHLRALLDRAQPERNYAYDSGDAYAQVFIEECLKVARAVDPNAAGELPSFLRDLFSPAQHVDGEVPTRDPFEQSRGVRADARQVDEHRYPMSPFSLRQERLAEPQQPSPAGRSDPGAFVNDMLELVRRSLGQEGVDASAKHLEPRPETSTQSQSAASHALDKGKGKAKAETAQEPRVFPNPFQELLKGAFDQEARDIERAIMLSLQERDAAEAKKASTVKATRSSAGASSSKVKFESSSASSFSQTDGTVRAVHSSAGPEPVSPLTTVRAVRNRLSVLESAFKFPLHLDFERSELAVSPNNAPVRAYEQALNGLLEELDSIASDGDEEVRGVRREVVKEVERALETVERKVREQAPPTIPEAAQEEAQGYDVEMEGAAAPTSQIVPSIPVAPSAEDAVAAEPEVSPALIPTKDTWAMDANIEATTPAEYAPAAPVPTLPEITIPDDSESASASESVVTITPAPKSASAPASPVPETFLSSISHDQFTFPPQPSSGAETTSAQTQDDGVFLGDSSEDGSVKSAEDGWSDLERA
ncbi:hypothetical protein BC834DRAFT_520505 [Gloeopeniophorella convolvens]|nr:hypothetical protein BC834DRAFT_520505 [Gloeopeniophorella convolvens]